MFRLIEKGDIAYYTVTEIEETCIANHCFTTRRGGVSKGIYESMNLRFHCDDPTENVRENYRRICSAIGSDYRRLVHSKQVHEDKVIRVDGENAGNGIIRENVFTSADALTTNETGLPIMAAYADCVPILLLDPAKRAVAAVHSGWRGTAAKISAKAVLKMRAEYGTDPADVIAAVGPSIQEKSFEVGDEVAEVFLRLYGNETARRYGEKYHVNLQRAIELQLEEAGVKRIVNSGIDTYDNAQLLFSHRKTNGQRGAMAAIIELKK